MRRFTILLCMVLMMGAVFAPAVAQEPGTTLPAIVTFTADLPEITVADAEAGTTPVTLRWSTVDMQPGQSLALDAYALHEWTSLLEAGDALEPAGERTMMVQHPLNFGPPTYRLSLQGADGATIDQRVVSIPYADNAEGATTSVETFTSSAADVAPGENGVVIVPVTWAVANRLPSAYLAFEQVLPDGQMVSIDLPRTTLWVASSGEGAVAPTIPAGAATVTLLLRVVDAATEQTYDTAQLTLPVAGMVPPATLEPPPAMTPEPLPEGTPEVMEGSESAAVMPAETGIFYFQPSLVGSAADGQFALVWDVMGAPAVQVAYTDAAGNPVIRSGLKATGDLAIPLAEVGFAPEAGRYQFTLAATDATGVPLTDASGLALSQTVEIPAETPIVISSFATDATTVIPGQPIGLSWDVSGATNVVLSRLSVQMGAQLFSEVVGEALPAAGSLTFTLPEIADTGFFGDQVTFLLTAEDGSSASRTAYLRLPIQGQSSPAVETTALPTSDLTINLFTVEPLEITPGGVVSLAWDAAGASRVWLAQTNPGTGAMATIADNLPLAGSLQIAVPAEIAADQLPLTTGFVLRAENAAGEIVEQDALITIAAP